MPVLSRIAKLSLLALLAACSSNAPPPAAPKPASSAAPASEAAAAKEQALYDQMRASQSWDLAVSLGEEIVNKYPASAAAAQVRRTLDEVRAKATARRDSRCAVESKEPLKAGASAKDAERIRLVLRVHPKWGRSVYLLLDNAKFDCSKGCATLPVRFDDAPAQRMKATIPPTGEPALFIDDDKGFIAKMASAKTVAIDATIKGEGAKTFVFEVGGYDATKLPAGSKK